MIWLRLSGGACGYPDEDFDGQLNLQVGVRFGG